MIIAIASDHAGYAYKTLLVEYVQSLGHEVIDFGTHSAERCDYPDFIRPAALAVSEGKADRGIVLGGSGNGEAIVSNRISGIRCGVVWNEESSKMTRLHNDANMISLGERMMDEATAKRVVEIFLTEEFEGGRHIPRIQKIDHPDFK